jgi:predicted aspartyl protease
MPKDAKKYLAIWDTGATGSVITKKVVDDCGLKPIGMAKVHHAQGVETTPVYLVSIVLPNKVIVPSLRVTEGKLVGNVEVLIGMDIIGLGDFAVSNKDGVTVFSYRTPSIERIDFVQQLNNASKPNSPPTYSKIGRNAPCPCGSGKKYKNCHGR